jgi:hypothetical protein
MLFTEENATHIRSFLPPSVRDENINSISYPVLVIIEI